MLECVANVSEGNDASLLQELAECSSRSLLDVHADAVHNRTVFTLAGVDVEDSVRRIAEQAIARLDIRRHHGVHPRLGVIDVVPFVPFDAAVAGTADAGFDAGTTGTMQAAITARNEFAAWLGDLGVPCFLYGPERSLPDVRRQAWDSLLPATGPMRPHDTAGSCCVGARTLLVAYNIWIKAGPEVARKIAKSLRTNDVRTLGLDLGGLSQVSCNLIEPLSVGPSDVYDQVAAQVEIDRAELVGLIPAALLHATPRRRWAELDLDESKTIESRFARVQTL